MRPEPWVGSRFQGVDPLTIEHQRISRPGRKWQLSGWGWLILLGRGSSMLMLNRPGNPPPLRPQGAPPAAKGSVPVERIQNVIRCPAVRCEPPALVPPIPGINNIPILAFSRSHGCETMGGAQPTPFFAAGGWPSPPGVGESSRWEGDSQQGDSQQLSFKPHSSPFIRSIALRWRSATPTGPAIPLFLLPKLNPPEGGSLSQATGRKAAAGAG